MPYGYQGFVGSAAANTTASELQFNSGITVPVNNHIIVAACMPGVSATLTTVSDQAGNTYFTIWALEPASNLVVFFARVTSQLNSGQWIKVTIGSSQSGDMIMGAAAYTGLDITTGNSALDKFTGLDSTNNPLSSGVTATRTTARQLLFGVAHNREAGTSVLTNPGGWTEILNTTQGQRQLIFSHQFVTSTGTDAYAPDNTGGIAGTSTVQTFKEAAASSLPVGSRVLLGVGT